jgi:hypothetical protein
MRKLIASAVTGVVLSMGLVVATPAPMAQAAQVHKPHAKPGQFCAKRDHNDWTKTAHYGKLRCKHISGGWHWKRI